MSAMPLPFVLSRLAGLISILLLISGLWFVADWVSSDFRGGFWLAAGAAMLFIATCGRALLALTFRRHPERHAAPPPESEVEAVTGSGGARLHVKAYGPPRSAVLVLTHGWGLDHTIWDDVVRALAGRYRVVVWDLPGLGRSGRPLDGVYSVERFAADLRLVIAATGSAPVVLVGQGAGASVTLECCRQHPELLSRKIMGVALLNGAEAPLLEASSDSTLLRSIRRAVIDPLVRVSIAASPVVHLMAWAAYLNGLSLLVSRAYAFGPDPARRDVDCAAWLSTRQAPSVLAKGLRAFMDWNGSGAAAGVSVPLLALAGAQDLLVKPECVRATAEAAPLGRFMEVDGVGHLGVLERPEIYAEALMRHAEHVSDRARRQPAGSHAEVLRMTQEVMKVPDEPKSFVNDDGGDAPAAEEEEYGAQVESERPQGWP